MRLEVRIYGTSPRLQINLVSEENEIPVDIVPHLPTYRELALRLGIRISRRDFYYFQEKIPLEGWNQGLQFLLIRAGSTENLARLIHQTIWESIEKALTPAAVITSFSRDYPSFNLSFQPLQPVLIIGEKVFRLALQADESDVITQIRSQLEGQLAGIKDTYTCLLGQFKAETELQLETLRRKLAEIAQIPPITLDDVKEGLTAWIADDWVYFTLPFTYSPKYILTKELEIRQIKTELQEKLKRNLFLKFGTQSGYLRLVTLTVDRFGELLFEHYHYNCWGSWRPPTDALALPQDLYLIRNQLERLLEIINMGSLARVAPRGLIPAKDLLEASEKCGELAFDPLQSSFQESPRQVRRRDENVWTL